MSEISFVCTNVYTYERMFVIFLMKELQVYMERMKSELFQLFKSLNPSEKCCFCGSKVTEIIDKIFARTSTTYKYTRKDKKIKINLF